MAQFNKETDLHVTEIAMSDYQLNIYENAREGERKMEMEQAKRRGRKKRAQQGGDVYEESVSTYRIFSRAFCNFVFPGDIGRPLPQENEDIKTAAQATIDEDTLDNATTEEKIQNIDGRFGLDDATDIQEKLNKNIDSSYEKRIKAAMEKLKQKSSQYLSKEALVTFSPKFLAILNTIQSQTGLHLVYSQFRTLEGIGIFKLVLEANGFAQLKIAKKRKGDGILYTPKKMRQSQNLFYILGQKVQKKKKLLEIFLTVNGVESPAQLGIN